MSLLRSVVLGAIAIAGTVAAIREECRLRKRIRELEERVSELEQRMVGLC